MSFEDRLNEKLKKYGPAQRQEGNDNGQKKLAVNDTAYSGVGQPTRTTKPTTFEERLNEKLSRYSRADQVNDQFLKDYVNDYNAFQSTAQKDRDSMDYTNASEVFGSRQKVSEDLKQRRTAIDQFLTLNRSRLEAETVEELEALSKTTLKGTSDTMKAFQEALEWYSYDFEEGARETARLESVLREYRGLSRWESDEKSQVRLEELRQQYGSEDAIQKLIEQNRRTHKLHEDDRENLMVEALRSEADFRELSRYKSTADGSQTRIDPMTGTIYGSQFADPLYDYVNRNGDAVIEQWHNNHLNDMSYVESMTDDEVAMYNYLYAKEGADRAKAYLNSIRTRLTARQMGQTQSLVSDMATQNGFLGSLAASAVSVGLSPVSGFKSTLGQLGSALTGREIDPNASYNLATNTKNTLRQAVSGKVEENFGPVGSFFYGTGMSMLDMLMDSTSGNSVVAAAMIESRAFSETVIDGKNRGLSDKQAMTLGVISAGAEFLTERLGVDELLRLPKGWENAGFWKGVMKGAVGEAGEEGLTNIINLVADVAISGERSEFQQNIHMFMQDQLDEAGNVIQPGVSKEEATKKAVIEALKSFGLDTLAGAVSGGVFGGVSGYSGKKAAAVTATAAEESSGVPAVDVAVSETEMANPAEGDDDLGEDIDEPHRRTIEEVAKEFGQQGSEVQRLYEQGQDVDRYADAFRAVFDMGRSGVREEYATKHESAQYLTKLQREQAYLLGQGVAKRKLEMAQQKLGSASTGRRKGTVTGHNITPKDIQEAFNTSQRAAYKSMAFIAEATGVDLVIYQSKADPETGALVGEVIDGVDMTGAEGAFSWKNDKIYIDINAGLVNGKQMGDVAQYAALRTFGHEFTHFCEKWNPEGYDQFRTAVFDAMARSGEDVDALIQRQIEKDRSLDYDGASREVVAEAMADILRDSNFVQRLAQENQSVFEKLRARLKEFLEDLRSYFAKLNPNEDIGAKALQQELEGSMRYFDEIVELWDQMAEDAVKRRQSEQSDTAGDKADQVDTQYSYGGRKARNADLAALEEAKKMAEAGISAKTIFRKTGWYQGADGKWRFEIDDSKLRYDKTGNLRGAKTGEALRKDVGPARKALGEAADDETMEKVRAYDNALILKNGARQRQLYEELSTGEFGKEFQRYAAAKNAVLDSAKNDFGGRLADYIDHPALFEQYPELRDMELQFRDLSEEGYGGYYDGEKIVMDESLLDAPENFLVHEIQHAIQDIEGFASGSNKEYWAGVQEGDQPMMKTPEGAKLARKRARRALTELPGAVARSDQMAAAMELDLATYAAKKFVDRTDVRRDPYELYVSTAGEIEARDVSRRRNMSAEQRKKRLPDTGDGNTVFAEDVHGATAGTKISGDVGKVQFAKRAEAPKYSYEWFLNKPDMKITEIDDSGAGRWERNDILDRAIANAKSVGMVNQNGNAVIRVSDNGADVVISRGSLKHGMDRRTGVIGAAAANVGDILKNAVQVNELYPRDNNIKDSYVLIGAAKNKKNEPYIVSFVVNRHSHKLVEMDVLYSVNAKTEPAGSLSPRITDKSAGSFTGSNISIEHLLDFVNAFYPDILPEDVLKHYGHDARPEGKIGNDALYRRRGGGLSDWEVLNRASDALGKEKLSQAERGALEIFQGKLAKLEGLEKNRAEQAKIWHDNQFSEDGDRELARKARNRMGVLDTQIQRGYAELLSLEDKQVLHDVLKKARGEVERQERELIRDSAKRVRERYEDSRSRTAMRHRIQKVVKTLNDLLLKPDKKRHVPEGLRKAVAEALEMVNMEPSDTAERISRYDELIAKETDQDKKDAYMITRQNILDRAENMKGRLDALRAAYEEIKNAADPEIANAYDANISECLLELSGTIGDTSIQDMSMEQLSDVYDMYKAVLTTIQNANKARTDALTEGYRESADAAEREITGNGKRNRLGIELIEQLRKFGINNLKPVYFFEYLNSKTFRKLYQGLMKGQSQFGRNMAEARDFQLEQAKKYGAKNWDKEKTWTFRAASGDKFSLNLEQIMSLYAYSKRDQAREHIRKGGIVIDSETKIQEVVEVGGVFKVKLKGKSQDATAYNIDDVTLDEIIGKLTVKQRAFVNAMQDYLSDTMGSKGNEVSMKLYGIKLFKEKHYFPLRSAQEYSIRAKEQAEQTARLKNAGFTKATKPHANNPILLSEFSSVWGDHVQDMSQYHAMTLPIEDLYRVYNYSRTGDGVERTRAVVAAIKNAFGEQATGYVDQLMKDMNGKKFLDSAGELQSKLVSRFKKGAVFMSASVLFQQSSSVARALAEIDAKYLSPVSYVESLTVYPRQLLGLVNKNASRSHDKLWAELKEYAPIAVIKEMGYFDMNMGKSGRDYLNGEEYSGFLEKLRAFRKDGNFRDELLSRGPALADELAWCDIWRAVKREQHAKHPGMKVSSKEFLELCGQRFTEVIDKTQVYDSVLSRSANMRSGSELMKMATSFMAEPTVTANMLANALLEGKRGHKGKAGRIVGSVVAANIINAALAALVYAARDDDEDKEYWEKYLGHLAGEVIDSMNPLTYIPIVQDVLSVCAGWDVERADMAVVSDLVNAIKKLSSDEATTWEKTRDMLGATSQLLNLPVKNLLRDGEALWRVVNDAFDEQESTATGIGYAVRAELPEWISGGGVVTNEDQLYEAILSGDKAHEERVRQRYKDKEGNIDEGKVTNARRKALRKNDSRIHEAAVYLNDDQFLEYYTIVEEIAGEGYFHKDDVVSAVQSEANSLLPDGEKEASEPKHKSAFKAEHFAIAASRGDSEMMGKIKADFILTAQSNGKTEREAESAAVSSIRGAVKEAFVETGMLNEAQARKSLMGWCDATEKEAADAVNEWAFEKQNGYPLSDLEDVFVGGEITADKAEDFLVSHGGYARTEAESKVLQWQCEKDTGIRYDDVQQLYVDGKMTADKAKELRVEYGESSIEDARKTVLQWTCEKDNGVKYGDIDVAYLSGDITEKTAIDWLVKYGEKDRDKAGLTVQAYRWRNEHTEYKDLSDTAIDRYIDHCEGAGISIPDFYEINKRVSEIKEAGGTQKENVVNYIRSLPLSRSQKWAMWYAVKNTNWVDNVSF